MGVAEQIEAIVLDEIAELEIDGGAEGRILSRPEGIVAWIDRGKHDEIETRYR